MRPLVGRGNDLAVLDTVLVGDEPGLGLLLRGGAGVGRTALLQTAAERARAQGRRTAWVTGARFESKMAWSGLHQLQYALRRDLARLPLAQRRLIGEVSDGAGDADRPAIAAAVLALLAEAAAESPIALFLDDVQWIDRASAELLTFAARLLRNLPGVVIMGSSTLAGTPLARCGLREHEVEPLTESAASRLLTVLHPGLCAPVRRRVLAEAEGNPLALRELPAALTDHQRSGAVPLPVHLPASPRLIERFRQQLLDLPANTRRLLVLFALDGAADLATVSRAAPGLDVIAVLAPAEGDELIELRSDRMVFAHHMIRMLVVHLASSAERRSAHAALARVASTGSDARAWHLAETATGPDNAVACALADLGNRAAERGLLTAAATALGRAAELSARPAERSARRADAAHLAWQSGWQQWSAALCEDLAAADGAAPGGTAMRAYFRSLRDGDLDTAHGWLLRSLEDRSATPVRHAVLLEMLYHVCFLADQPRWWESFDALLWRGDPTGSTMVRLCRDITVGPGYAHGRLLSLLRMSSPADLDMLSVVALGGVAVATDAATEFRRSVRGRVPAEVTGSRFVVRLFGIGLAVLDQYQTGNWDRAEALARRGAALAAADGLCTFGAIFDAQLALLAAVRGRGALAMKLAEDVLRWAVPRRIGLAENLARQARALAALGAGDHDQAYVCMSRITPAEVSSSTALTVPWMLLDLVDAAVSTGHLAQATAYVDAAWRSGLQHRSPRIALVIGGAAALVARGDRTGTVFREALALPGRGRWPFELARIRLAYGEWLRRNRDIAAARRELGESLETLERLGAEPWAARARHELLAASPQTGRG